MEDYEPSNSFGQMKVAFALTAWYPHLGCDSPHPEAVPNLTQPPDQRWSINREFLQTSVQASSDFQYQS